MPMLPNLNAESWKYSNINAALKKLDVVAANCAWNIGDIVIPKNTKIETPIELNLVGVDRAQFDTTFSITVESGAEVTIIERQFGTGAYWKNIDLNITLAPNAKLNHYRLSDDDALSVVTERTVVKCARDARYNMVTFSGAAAFGRADFNVYMEGEGAECDVSGLALLNGKRHADTTICVHHIAPHCKSSQFFKTILDDQSRGVFQGKIHVYKDAQKTDGYQLSNNLLLSNLAEMDIKPELEIYADDVKCSHGSTTGQLDETPLFYLMSRGISKDDARRLLLEAFMGEVLDKISGDEIRQLFDERVGLWLK